MQCDAPRHSQGSNKHYMVPLNSSNKKIIMWSDKEFYIKEDMNAFMNQMINFV